MYDAHIPVPMSHASKLQLVEKLVRRNFLTRDLRSPVLLSKLLVSPLITSIMLPYTVLQSTPPSRSLDSSSGCIGVYKAIAGIYYHQPPVECLHLILSSNEYEAPSPHFKGWHSMQSHGWVACWLQAPIFRRL